MPGNTIIFFYNPTSIWVNENVNKRLQKLEKLGTC